MVIMDYIKKIFGLNSKKAKIKTLSEEEKLTLKLKPFQSYLYRSQDIITWEDPAESALALLLVNIVFWFLSYLQWRVYGVVFSVVCMMVAHEAWVDHIWPEIGIAASEKYDVAPEEPPRPGVLTVPEISHYATGIRAAASVQYAKLRLLRKSQPPMYCALVSAGCILMAVVGTMFSGMLLVYLTTVFIMVVPGIVKHGLPEEHKKSIFSILTSITSFALPPDGTNEDYIPEVSKENMLLLNQAGDNFDLSTPTTEDSSLADIMMPGHDESSVDTFDSLALPSIPQAESSDTDSEVGALRFKSEHFDKAENHSSDEEASLLKDLNFPDVKTSSALKDVVAGVLYKTFPKAFASQYQTPAQEDSDSDFEIIEPEDAS